MNLGDPELELVDPTPNIHSLFIHFDKLFFWTKLASRAVVRWSKRMYSCAGICSYEGRGGLCDIALSEPLLKLRPRKDLIETLLHEMIHAFLFVTCRDQDRDGHGPNFQAHMHRINKAAGLNISIYHDFHDEVELYQTHWWRCNGPCQSRKPYFGIVRRSANRPPGPKDYWWNSHKRTCGGTFIKIKEPEKKGKKKATNAVAKPKEDITKYITSQKTVNNNVLIKNANNKVSVQNPTAALPPNVHTINSVLKDNTNTCGGRNNGNFTTTVTQKTNNKSPQTNKPPVFIGKGQSIGSGNNKRISTNAAETVRNVWANKRLSSTTVENIDKESRKPNSASAVKRNSTSLISNNIAKPNKSRASLISTNSPPTKIMKIDDYFKTAATVLKDIYGQDFKITQNDSKRLVAFAGEKSNVVEITHNNNNKTSVASTGNHVNCPVCNMKVENNEINRHLDECLNKDIINSLSVEETAKLGNENNVISQVLDLVEEILPNSIKESISDVTIKTEPSTSKAELRNDLPLTNIIVNKRKTSRDADNNFNKEKPVKLEPKVEQTCACCNKVLNNTMEEHLEECLAFFDNDATVPEEGASTSFADGTIVIDDDDDDQFDESQIFNETGTKFPCPCCLEMFEEVLMNEHLDTCLK